MPFLNAVLKRIEGDMSLLPLTNSWHVLMLEHGQVVLLSSEDMKCAFYLFRLPDSWLPWLCFSLPATRGALGLDGDATELMDIALAVVPTGWDSATGVVQHVHRSLCKFAGFPAGLEVRRDRPLRSWFIARGGKEPDTVTAHVLFQL